MTASRFGLFTRSVFGVGGCLFAYYLLFRLPYWFPPQLRLRSASYAFGFNNAVAILSMGALLGALTLYLLRTGAKSHAGISFSVDRLKENDRSQMIGAFALVTLLYTLLTCLMYLYNEHSAPWLMWETRHLLHRTWLMDVYHLRPYTEVAAEYGPILTYAPLYMFWLLKPLGASHELAYFACHLVLNLAGVWCAYYLLSRAVMPARSRAVTFVILAVAGFAPYMGLNGVLVRYLMPFTGVLLGHRAVVRALSGTARWRWIHFAAVVFLLLALNILISPEIGIAFGLAWFTYGLLMTRRDVRVLILSVIALILTALLCWILLPVEYYGTLLRFSEGAANLPLLPAPHLLLYILTLFLLIPSLLATSFRADLRSSEVGGALGVLCLVMAPGALGRCDPPHVLLYGMGASMLLMVRLSRLSRRAFVAYAVAYAAVFIIFFEIVNLLVFYGISPRTVLSNHPFKNVVQRLRAANRTVPLDAATLSKLNHYPRLGLPFASYGDPAVETYVLSRQQLQPEYYVGVVGIYSRPNLERKLRDVSQADYLLLPQFASHSTMDSCPAYLKSLRAWFLYPAKLPCRATPLDPFTALKSYIADHYVQVDEFGSWSILRKVNTRSATSASE